MIVLAHILLLQLHASLSLGFPLSPQLMSAMIEKMGDQDGDPLPQEAMDGCDSDEWSDS